MQNNIKVFFLLVLLTLIGCVGKVKHPLETSLKKENQESAIFILSSRFFHPRDSQDKANTIEAIDKLRPNRIDWIYYQNDEILEIYQKKGLQYSLTLNPQIPDPDAYATKKYRIEDFNGELYVAPWMKTWKSPTPHWGCVNNPKFYELFLKRGLFLAKKKAYALMVDDASFNSRLEREKLVGCFCTFCKEKFKSLYHNKNSKIINIENVKSTSRTFKEGKVKLSQSDRMLIKEYENFQEESVVEFLQKWRKDITKIYPEMLFYTNNYSGKWNKIYSVFDGGIAELNANQINDKTLTALYTEAAKLNKKQIFTCASQDDKTQIKLIQYNIKHNKETILPWDIFIAGSDMRYYMDLEKIQQTIKKIK